jgi:microcystin degradation protein MlrC
MRFAIAGIVHESNSFAPVPTELADFEVLRDGEILEHHADAFSTVTGYLDACREAGVEAVPLVLSSATPSGPITVHAYETLIAEMLHRVATEGPWDGVLLSLHGAAVADAQDDADGEILRRVRDLIGPDVPLAATLDMHANVSPGMVEHADVVVVWKTNPHVDPQPRGRRAAELIIATARGEIRPTSALRQVPVALNILKQYTNADPMRALVAALDEIASRERVLDASLAEGFPWADVPAMGMSTLVITDRDPDLAAALADELADTVWERREEFDAAAPSPAEAVRSVMASTEGPILLLDVGDNIGGGAPGDSVIILHEVRRQGATGVVATVAAADAARACHEAGVGSKVSLTVGAATDDRIGPPFAFEGVVTAVSDGQFEDPMPTHGGKRYYDAGPSAAVDIGDGNTVVVTTLPMNSHSPIQLTSLGLDLADYRAIVAKGVNSPLAGYLPVVTSYTFVDTPGCSASDLSSLTFERRPVPMLPFEKDARLRA